MGREHWSLERYQRGRLRILDFDYGSCPVDNLPRLDAPRSSNVRSIADATRPVIVLTNRNDPETYRTAQAITQVFLQTRDVLLVLQIGTGDFPG